MYQALGCDTLQYILPTRFIFRHTDQVHQAMEDVAGHLKARGLMVPCVVHCLSDTGCMALQGLNIATFSQGFPLTPRGRPCTVLYVLVLYCTPLYVSLLYFTVLYCTVLYSTVLT